ncbi:C-type lectin domain family 10 member A isoform X4 [Etheostoma spectabile]|uniref:C-type lectin domain family 10 member A isoform X4 n=1 Tax=Etheostoma spectabile TaxID=54343 RepID=UPI0013AF3A06|nr:C-type lectin domain family 10 member A-like isoform X4 [Etheostoma spectabile]
MKRNPQEEIEEIIEEASYVNAPVCTVEKVAAPPDQRSLFFSRSSPLIAVCWLILLVIMGLRIYFTSVISENDAKLRAENQQLKARNQELETQIQNMTTVDDYCPKENNVSERRREACQEDWFLNESNCYEIHDADPSDQKTWEEARANCRGYNADFVVVHRQEEKDMISGYSWGTQDESGYWIGLRVENGRWKWIDGSDLAVDFWIGPPFDGHCAVSVQGVGWTSASCADRKRWICKKKALGG